MSFCLNEIDEGDEMGLWGWFAGLTGATKVYYVLVADSGEFSILMVGRGFSILLGESFVLTWKLVFFS